MQVGYRGVDGSRRLDCPAFTRALRHRHRDLLSDASIREPGGAGRRTCGGCRAGVDLAGYTLEVVADAEAARQALDLDQVDLLSVSYGTRVAQTYARLHPQRVRRSAMLGSTRPAGSCGNRIRSRRGCNATPTPTSAVSRGARRIS